jgi:hypothetical protein
MYLLEDEAQIFYKLWLSLLDYTNKKYKICPKLKELKNSKSINPQDLSPIKNKLWENKNLIDEYLNMNGHLHSKDEVEIINGWKRNIAGKFIILKHLKNYTVFMAIEDDIKLYGVIGISNPIEIMFSSSALPVCVNGVLIPFKGKIIYDSILYTHNISFGSGAKKGFNEDYRKAKVKYGISTTI